MLVQSVNCFFFAFSEYAKLMLLCLSPYCSAAGLHLSAWLNPQVALLSRKGDVDDVVECVIWVRSRSELVACLSL